MQLLRNSLLFFIIMAITGCSQQALLRSRYYSETITGFYLNSRDSILLIAGKEYSYIVDCKYMLCHFIEESRGLELSTHLTNLELTPSGNITGSVTFQAPYIPLITKIQDYIDIGLLKEEKTLWGEYTGVHRKIPFSAKVYKVSGKLPFEEFKNPIAVSIKKPKTKVTEIGQMIVKPAAIILDTTVMIAVAPFYLAFIFYAYSDADMR